MKTTVRAFVVVFLVLFALPRLVSAQTTAAGPNKPAVGVAIKASTFGIGIDGAVRVHRKVNLRAGFNFLSLSHDFENTDDNITYKGDLKMRSMNAYVDWFPFGGGFHISPAFMLNHGTKVSLSSTTPAGQTIDIDDTPYQSSSSNPIKAAGEVSFKNGRPGIIIGWGNITGHRRVTVPFELGVIFSSAPIGKLSFTGTACQTNGTNCRDIATDATIQTHVRAAEADLNDTIRVLRFYPVLSLGVSFRF